MFLIVLLLAPIFCAINSDFSSSSCVCDVTSSCDYLCCCDSSCKKQIVTAWKESNLCHPTNSNGLAINMCANTKPAQISDLYSGLRMIYEIIKRLFCIQTINFNASLSSYNPIVSSQSASSNINNYISSYSSATSGFSNPYNSVKQQVLFKGNKIMFAIPLGNSNCGWGQLYPGVDIPVKKCKSSLLNVQTNPPLKVQTFKNKSYSSVFIYDQNGVDLSSIQTSSWGAIAPYVLTNIVVEALAQITLNKDRTAVTSVNVELIVANISSYTYNNYQQRIGVVWRSQDDFQQKTGSVGYSFGSNLIVVDNKNISTINPVRMSFAQSDGTCKTSSSSTAKESSWNIKFGQDFAVFCNTNDPSTIAQKIVDAFKMLGSIGAPNPKYSLDYINVNGSLSQSGVLSIYYSPIGQQSSSQFQIMSAVLSDLTKSNSGPFSFFVEFKEIPTSLKLYTPPPPIVQVRLANDVLYPFHIY